VKIKDATGAEAQLWRQIVAVTGSNQRPLSKSALTRMANVWPLRTYREWIKKLANASTLEITRDKTGHRG
jgi:hypothetical protein